ncbi:hypothetical protein H4219_002216 [Mycoemilia scoparia]|uniref:Adenylate cyclase n=1 Tax=Mycoemilia scoparia TaxID=417184 RepID=A0A9W8A4M4_9FUNG|nr:hypothetical protein H4219_002216 [Mycoemilia scoparia]
MSLFRRKKSRENLRQRGHSERGTPSPDAGNSNGDQRSSPRSNIHGWRAGVFGGHTPNRNNAGAQQGFYRINNGGSAGIGGRGGAGSGTSINNVNSSTTPPNITNSSSGGWFKRSVKHHHSHHSNSTPPGKGSNAGLGGPIQLDTDFSDLSEFVDLTQLRRPSLASSAATADSLKGVGASSQQTGGSHQYPRLPGHLGGEGDGGPFAQDLLSLDLSSSPHKAANQNAQGRGKESIGLEPSLFTSFPDGSSNDNDFLGSRTTLTTPGHDGAADPLHRQRNTQYFGAISQSSLDMSPMASVAMDSLSQINVPGPGLRDGSAKKIETWAPPESWAVLQPPPNTDANDGANQVGGQADSSDSDSDGSAGSDAMSDGKLYSLRICREDSTFGTFSCRLSTTTNEFMNMASKKFFISDIAKYCLYMEKANGLDRMLGPNERPAAIFKNYLRQMGYCPEDGITWQGREDNSYLCRFTLSKAVIPKVSPNIEDDIDSFEKVDLRFRKLQTVPVFLYARAAEIEALNISKNPGLNFPTDFVQQCENLNELRLATCRLTRCPPSLQFLPQLTFLDLSGNRLKRLRNAPFGHLKQLKTLMLRNNRLVELPQSMTMLKHLETLNASNNNFSSFPEVIVTITSLKDLDLSFNRIPSVPDTICELDQLKRLVLMANGLGGELPDVISTLTDLTELDVRRNNLQSLSKIASLPNLAKLRSDDNRVTQVRVEIRKAEFLSLSGNKLIQFRLFNPSFTLSELDISKNQLTELEKDLFEHLPNVRRLILNNNHLVSLPTSIHHLKYLEVLRCTNNTLVSLPVELTTLENLIELDLHNNNLRSLPAEIWYMPNLMSLNLSSNLLEQFPHPSALETLQPRHDGPSSVRAMGVTTVSSASRQGGSGGKNGAENSSDNSLAKSNKIGRLKSSDGSIDLDPHISDQHSSSQNSIPVSMRRNSRNRYGQYNPLVGSQAVGEAAGKDRQLTVSFADQGGGASRPSVASTGSSTPVTPLPKTEKPRKYTPASPPPLSKSLKILRLGENHLDDEFFLIVLYLPKLTHLNLSYNDLFNLSSAAMSQLPALTELHLSGTQISVIPEEEPNVQYWPSLKTLHINSNKLQTLPAWFTKLKHLSVLDAGSNSLKYNISNWQYDWNWNWNPDLKYLNLSYNERLEIKGPHFYNRSLHEHHNPNSSHRSLNTARTGPSVVGGGGGGADSEPSADVSNFYRLTQLQVLGLLQLTVLVPLPEETPNRRVRTTDDIRLVRYGMADSLGKSQYVSAKDMVISRFRRSEDEILFGMFHAHKSTKESGVVINYLCDHFGYVLRQELDKVDNETSESEGPEPEASHIDRTNEGESAKHIGGSDMLSPINGSVAQPDGDANISAPTTSSRRPSEPTSNSLHNDSTKELSLKEQDHNGREKDSVHSSHPGRHRSTERSHRASVKGVKDSLRRTFLTVNKDLGTCNLGISGRNRDDSHSTGATATIAFVQNRVLYVANVGDTLAVLSWRGNPVMMSSKHDPYDNHEMWRIRKMGGYISQQGLVQGQLGLTRAFGYFSLLPIVNANPSIFSRHLTEEDEFLIIANRALWNVMTPQTATDIARKHWRGPAQAAERLRDYAISYGATETVMVMVIEFTPLFAKDVARPSRGFSVRESVHTKPVRRLLYLQQQQRQQQMQAQEQHLSKHASVYSSLEEDAARRLSRTEGSHRDPSQKTSYSIRSSLSGSRESLTGSFSDMSMPMNMHQIPLTADQSYNINRSNVPGSSHSDMVIRSRRLRDREGSGPGDSMLARLGREVPPPIGEVALVFTDVKNSTAQWDMHPAAMRSAIKIHNSIMRRTLRLIGGYEVKTEGDAFMVSFSTIAGALRWCLEVQLNLLNADWPQEILDSENGKPIYWDAETNTVQALPHALLPSCSSGINSSTTNNEGSGQQTGDDPNMYTRSGVEGSSRAIIPSQHPRSASSGDIYSRERRPSEISPVRSTSAGTIGKTLEKNSGITALSAPPNGCEESGRTLIYRGLRVRMGVHFGTPVCEEDPVTGRMDYFGPMVNRAARVSGAADGGQIFLSQDVIDEVYAIHELFNRMDEENIKDVREIIKEATLANDVKVLRELGINYVFIDERKLKGLETPESLYMVYPDPLKSRFALGHNGVPPEAVKEHLLSQDDGMPPSGQAVSEGTGSSGQNKPADPRSDGEARLISDSATLSRIDEENSGALAPTATSSAFIPGASSMMYISASEAPIPWTTDAKQLEHLHLLAHRLEYLAASCLASNKSHLLTHHESVAGIYSSTCPLMFDVNRLSDVEYRQAVLGSAVRRIECAMIAIDRGTSPSLKQTVRTIIESIMNPQTGSARTSHGLL